MAWYTGKTFRGVDYNPTWPGWTQGPGEQDPNLRLQTFDSDMFNDAFASLWGKGFQTPPAGHASFSVPIDNGTNYRDDLGTIARDGFNLVRIYNWDVARGTPSGGDQNKGLDHANFLNYAKSLGLTVVVGLPDFMMTNGQFAWNHQMPDSTYSFGSATIDIQNDFKQFIASITDPATGKIFTNVHISVGNEGDIGEGGIFVNNNPGASTNASEFLARTNWWIHNLHLQINGPGTLGPDGLPVVNGPDGAIVPITATFSNADQGNNGTNGSWMNWVVAGAQAGQASPNGWQPSGQTFTTAVTGLATVDPTYASYYYNSFNIGQAPQTAPYLNGIAGTLALYDSQKSPWPGASVANVPLMLMEVFNANRTDPNWGNPTNQALSAVNEAKAIEQYLLLNKAGTPGSTTNVMGYNYFEFNDEPAAGKSVGLYQYGNTSQPAHTGTSGIFYIGRGGFEDFVFPVYSLTPTPGPNGQGTLVGAWTATFPTFLNSHNDAFVVLQGSSLGGAASSSSVAAAAVPFGVLTNDLSESVAAVAVKSAAANGQLQLGEDGGIAYTARPGFTGVDVFSYFAFGDYGASDSSGVAIHVVPVTVGPTTTTLKLLDVTPGELVAATYAAYLGRAADAAGYEFWVGQFNAIQPAQGTGAALANVAHSFGTSAEAKALYPFLANPGGASDAQIAAFVGSVYTNLFDRAPDAGGSAYWVGQIKQAVQAGQSADLVVVNIMAGAQETASNKDITTLMSRVALSQAYVHQQELFGTVWAGASDIAAATTLLDSVTADPLSLLIGVRTAEELIANHP